MNLTLCARTAREAKCFAAVASALFRCREADLSRGRARQVQMPGAGLRARIYRWFWAIGCSSNTLRDDLNQERATSATLTFGSVTRAARLQIRRFRATQRAAERSPSISAFEGGQPQLGEKQLDAGGIAGISRSHAAPTSWTVLSSS